MSNLARRPLFRFGTEVYVTHDFHRGCYGTISRDENCRLWGVFKIPAVASSPFCFLPGGEYVLEIELVVPNDYEEVGPRVSMQFRVGRVAGRKIHIHFYDLTEWESVSVRFTNCSSVTTFEGRIPVQKSVMPNPFEVVYST